MAKISEKFKEFLAGLKNLLESLKNLLANIGKRNAEEKSQPEAYSSVRLEPTPKDPKDKTMEDIVKENLARESEQSNSLTVVIPSGFENIERMRGIDAKNINELVIPADVKTIGDNAFANWFDLKYVTLPDELSSLSDTAFANCQKIEDFYLTSNPIGYSHSANNKTTSKEHSVSRDELIKKLQQQCPKATVAIKRDNCVSVYRDGQEFARCSSYYHSEIGPALTAKGAMAGLVVVDDKVTSIKEKAFYQCSHASKVVLPRGTKEIGNNAFEDCERLKNVNIPYGVSSIGEKAFSGCLALETITIPNSVEQISSDAFVGCIDLKEINIEADAKLDVDKFTEEVRKYIPDITINRVEPLSRQESFITKDDLSLSSDKKTLMQCSPTKEGDVIIPDTVTSIDVLAFAGCDKVNSITIPESIKHVDFSAFYDCKNLSQIHISPNTTVDTNYLEFCPKVEVVVDGRANAGPAKQENEAIADRFGAIQDPEPAKTTEPKDVERGALPDPEPIKTTVTEEVVHGSLPGPEETTYQSGTTELERGSLPENEVLDSKIDLFPKCIESYAYAYCSGLNEITIPDNVDTIKEYAFIGCPRLTSVIIPDSVKTIENGAFSQCPSLESVSIPASVKYLDASVFKECDSLAELHISPDTSVDEKFSDVCPNVNIIIDYSMGRDPLDDVPAASDLNDYNKDCEIDDMALAI